ARNEKPIERLTLRDAVICGLAQALALVPGVSRSGGTISAALLLGYRREAAARFSFLLAIPAVLASGLFELKDIATGDAPVQWGPSCSYAMAARPPTPRASWPAGRKGSRSATPGRLRPLRCRRGSRACLSPPSWPARWSAACRPPLRSCRGAGSSRGSRIGWG